MFGNWTKKFTDEGIEELRDRPGRGCKPNLPENVQSTLPEGIKIEDVDVWFQDEARVGQRGTVTRTWAKKGSRLRLIRQQQFEYAYIFGAVCPKRDEAVGLIMPAVNTEAMLIHLEHISRKIPLGRHGVIILDKAAWHTTKRLHQPANLQILGTLRTFDWIGLQERVSAFKALACT